MNIALVIIFLFAALALALGLRAAHGKDMNLEQWSVGGRSFGAILVFVLMAGEIYTTFTFLGGSGWAYSKGAPTYYILCYGCLAFVLSYWLLPAIWRYARSERLISQPHFFTRKYDSPALGILVACVGIIALVPYNVLQLKGLGLIVSTASYGSIQSTAAILIGAVIVSAYVMISGVHGPAWNAVLKDTMILLAAVFLGTYLPLHLYGGFGAMFSAIDQAKPGFLALPAAGQGLVWFVSTVLLSALGFYMWPHTFGAVLTARSEGVFRKNAIFMPLYQLIMLFVFFVGFAAVLKVPGLTGEKVDLALLNLTIQQFDPWFVGLIGGAGLLTALVPGSMILIATSTLFANDIFAPLSGFKDEVRIGRIARYGVPVWALLAVWFAIGGGATIVTLLLMGYAFVTQLFPALMAALLARNPFTPSGAFCGILTGVAVVALSSASHATLHSLLPSLPEAVADLNVGLVALVVNFCVTVLVSAFTRRPALGAVQTR